MIANKTSINKEENQRVHGKFNLEFDLPRIFENIMKNRLEQDKNNRRKFLKSQSMNEASMQKYDDLEEQ